MKRIIALWAVEAADFARMEIAAYQSIKMGERIGFIRHNIDQFDPRPSEHNLAVSAAMVLGGHGNSAAVMTFYQSLSIGVSEVAAPSAEPTPEPVAKKNK